MSVIVDAGVDQREYRLTAEASQAVVNHSPDGFEWGYHGSGPAQLSLAIILDLGYPPQEARMLYQDFKSAFIAKADRKGFELHEEDIKQWLKNREGQTDIS